VIDIKGMLETLRKVRPIFHSEADFQHALAWEIHKQLPTYSVRLEYPLSLRQSEHLDILLASNSNDLVAIELKYKTRLLSTAFEEETFWLKDHSAQDCGRYDFLKDVQRLEEFISKHSNATGYAILLTNDSSYWKPPRNDSTVDANFRVHEGRIVHGTLTWGSRASKGTTKGREKAIVIRDTYHLVWQDYYQAATLPNMGNYTKFKYLLVRASENIR